MQTFSSVMDSSVSSNSSTICVPSAVVVGQQLNVTGRNASSLLFICHFSNGAGTFALKALDASFTSKMLLECDALFRFGCTLYLNCWFCGFSLKQTRSAFEASSTVTLNSPVQDASPSSPPSLSHFASIRS